MPVIGDFAGSSGVRLVRYQVGSRVDSFYVTTDGRAFLSMSNKTGTTVREPNAVGYAESWQTKLTSARISDPEGILTRPLTDTVPGQSTAVDFPQGFAQDVFTAEQQQQYFPTHQPSEPGATPPGGDGVFDWPGPVSQQPESEQSAGEDGGQQQPGGSTGDPEAQTLADWFQSEIGIPAWLLESLSLEEQQGIFKDAATQAAIAQYAPQLEGIAGRTELNVQFPGTSAFEQLGATGGGSGSGPFNTAMEIAKLRTARRGQDLEAQTATRTAQIQAQAQQYAADQSLKAAEVTSGRSYQASIIGSGAQVQSAGIGAEASRYGADQARIAAGYGPSEQARQYDDSGKALQQAETAYRRVMIDSEYHFRPLRKALLQADVKVRDAEAAEHVVSATLARFLAPYQLAHAQHREAMESLDLHVADAAHLDRISAEKLVDQKAWMDFLWPIVSGVAIGLLTKGMGASVGVSSSGAVRASVGQGAAKKAAETVAKKSNLIPGWKVLPKGYRPSSPKGYTPRLKEEHRLSELFRKAIGESGLSK